MEAICSSETLVDFNGLLSVISQKVLLFITTAVRTSNPTISGIFISVEFPLTGTVHYRYLILNTEPT
jgi:hypothetical protein